MVSRRLIRLGLFGAGIIAGLVALIPVVQLGGGDRDTWATIAAALAVLTAVVSAWTSQRVLELQEDSQEPSITVGLDLRRRPQLVQLRIANLGGSIAKEVEVDWDRPLLKVDGTPVKVVGGADGPDLVPVLPPGESTAVAVGVAHRFFELYRGATYSGTVRYRNASGKLRKQRFIISVEAHRGSLVYDEEEALTHRELQRIPDQLREIASEVAHLRAALLESRNHAEVDDSEAEEMEDNSPNPADRADG